jgi:hypothetical protein
VLCLAPKTDQPLAVGTELCGSFEFLLRCRECPFSCVQLRPSEKLLDTARLSSHVPVHLALTLAPLAECDHLLTKL